MSAALYFHATHSSSADAIAEVAARALDAGRLGDLVAFVSGRTAFLVARRDLAVLPSPPIDGEFAEALAAPADGRLLIFASNAQRAIIGFMTRTSVLAAALSPIGTCRACSAA